MQVEIPLTQSIPYAQNTLCRHTCNDDCQQFYQTYIYEKRLLIKQRQQVGQLIYLVEAQNVIKDKLIEKQNQKLKKRIKKPKAIQSSMALAQTLKRIALKLEDSVKPSILAGYLGITVGRAKYLQNQVIKCSDAHMKQNDFAFGGEHKLCEKFIVQQNVAQLNSAKVIYQEFLNEFHVEVQNLPFHKFFKWFKSFGDYSYRLLSCVNFKSQTKSSLEKRFEFAKQFETLLCSNQRIIFIDECSFGRNLKVARSWQKKQAFPLLQIQSGSSKTKSVIGAIEVDGFIAYKCVRGSVNSQVFGEFLHELLRILQQNSEENNFCLILDNASIHRTPQVLNLLSLVNYTFLPPYRPQLNCIEKLWAIAKRQLSRMHSATTFQEFHNIHIVLNNISATKVQNVCTSNLIFLQACLQRQQF